MQWNPVKTTTEIFGEKVPSGNSVYRNSSSIESISVTVSFILESCSRTLYLFASNILLWCTWPSYKVYICNAHSGHKCHLDFYPLILAYRLQNPSGAGWTSKSTLSERFVGQSSIWTIHFDVIRALCWISVHLDVSN